MPSNRATAYMQPFFPWTKPRWPHATHTPFAWVAHPHSPLLLAVLGLVHAVRLLCGGGATLKGDE